MRGVKVGICCELCLESNDDGKSRGGTWANKLRDEVVGSARKLRGLVAGSRGGRGTPASKGKASRADIIDGEVQGGHQQ